MGVYLHKSSWFTETFWTILRVLQVFKPASILKERNSEKLENYETGKEDTCIKWCHYEKLEFEWYLPKKCIDLEKANHFINNAVVGLSLISSIYTSTPTSGEENSESIFLQMCKVQKPFSCCEKQYWRQAEHNSFHIFPYFQIGQGTLQEAQTTLGRGRHCKFTKNVYHRVMARLWVSVVKHRTESVKISPWSLFSSQHVELRTPIPIITKSHAWSALHIACAPLLCLQIHLPLAQIPFFLVQHCSTSTLQLEESSCIFTLLWASSAKLPDYL